MHQGNRYHSNSSDAEHVEDLGKLLTTLRMTVSKLVREQELPWWKRYSLSRYITELGDMVGHLDQAYVKAADGYTLLGQQLEKDFQERIDSLKVQMEDVAKELEVVREQLAESERENQRLSGRSRPLASYGEIGKIYRNYRSAVSTFVQFFVDLQGVIAQEQKLRGEFGQYPKDYTFTMSYGEGTYFCHQGEGVVSDRFSQREYKHSLECTMEELQKVLQEALTPPAHIPSLPQGTKQPKMPIPYGAFAAYLGFSHFIGNYSDKYGLGEKLCIVVNNRINDLCSGKCLSDRYEEYEEYEGWGGLRAAALKRSESLLRASYYARSGREIPHGANFYYTQSNIKYTYRELYDLPSVTAIASKIVADEEKRFRWFVECVQGTLDFLAELASLPNDTELPEDVKEVLQTLGLTKMPGVEEQQPSPLPRSEMAKALQVAQAENEELKQQRDELKAQFEAEKDELLKAEKDLSDKNQDLEQQLILAQSRIKELEEERSCLMPGVLADEIVASFFNYLKRFRAAIGLEEGNSNSTKAVMVKDMLPSWDIKLDRDDIDTIFYSYNPSRVAHAYTLLYEMIETAKGGNLGMKRVVSEEILLGFSGLLGYDNLWRYLLQVEPSHRDSRFLRLLCDLSVPDAQVEKLASDLATAFWLEKHLPPLSKVVNASCCVKLAGGSSNNATIAKAIIEIEKANLLDFRSSLYMALSIFAPLSEEEFEKQEQSLRSEAQEPKQEPGQEHKFRYIEHLHKAKSDLYIVRYEYRNPSLIALPITTELIFNGKGEVFHPSE